MKASHFLVRQESGKEAPGPSVPLKNTKSNANNWRICVFLTRHSDGPGTQPAAQEPGLRPVGLGTRLRAQNGKRGGVFRRARNSKNDIRALTRCACRKTGFGIGRPTSRLPLPGKLFLRSGLSARTRCEMLACVRARNPIAPGAIPNIIFRRIRRMRAHECHSYCFVCVRKMPQLLPFGGSEPSERGVWKNADLPFIGAKICIF